MQLGFLIGLGGGLGVRAAVLFGGARLAAAEHPAPAADAAAHPAGRARLGLAAGRGRRRCRRAGDGGRRQRSVRGRLLPGARRCRWRCIAYLAYLSRPGPAGPQRARVVSGRPAVGGHVALRRRAAGADAAADRRQLRGPARAAWPSSSAACRRAPPSSACRPLTDAQIEALAEFVVAVLPAALGGLLGRHLRPQSLSRRAHRARLRPARARLAGPAGARLSAGLSRCSSPWRSRPRSRPARSAWPGTSFSGALLFAYLIAGPRAHALHRPRPRALDPVVRLRRPSSCSAPTPRLALIVARPARAGPQAQAPLRRLPAPST